MSKRNEIIKYLIDLGLDIDTQNDEIKGYCNDKHIFTIGDWREYQIEVSNGFKECLGNKANEVFMKMAEYCCVDVENRRDE